MKDYFEFRGLELVLYDNLGVLNNFPYMFYVIEGLLLVKFLGDMIAFKSELGTIIFYLTTLELLFSLIENFISAFYI